jgi:hypothetical protein
MYANANVGPSAGGPAAPQALWSQLVPNIKVRLIDESGNFIDPAHVNEVDYLSRFINKCVVNKIYQRMVADNRSGIIEVYNDKVLVKEN